MTQQCGYRLAVFDLDGTLIDSAQAITTTISSTLAHFGIAETDATRLRSCIGPALAEIYGERYGLRDANLAAALTLHRRTILDLLEEDPAANYPPFPGIPELLSALHQRAMRLAIATTRYTDTAVRILEALNLDFFRPVIGADDSQTNSDKTPLLREVITRYPMLENQQIVMIGDRRYDVEAAQCCGVDSIGVCYGYGSAEELSSYRPTYLVKQVEALAAVLLPSR